MLSPADVQFLITKSNAERRQIIALAAGLHASDDGDGGVLMAEALERIAARLRNAPRERAA